MNRSISYSFNKWIKITNICYTSFIFFCQMNQSKIQTVRHHLYLRKDGDISQSKQLCCLLGAKNSSANKRKYRNQNSCLWWFWLKQQPKGEWGDKDMEKKWHRKRKTCTNPKHKLPPTITANKICRMKSLNIGKWCWSVEHKSICFYYLGFLNCFSCIL